MGLDEFQYSDSSEESDNEEEDNQDDDSGLDTFSNNLYSSSNNSGNGADKVSEIQWIDDFSSKEWNSMSTQQKVEYIRRNHDPNFRPEVEIDDRFSAKKVNEIDCICNNSFVIDEVGMCLQCGRQYKDHGEVVELINKTEHNSTNDSANAQ